MRQIDPPVQLSPETMDALAVVHAWGRGFNDRDLDRLLSLSAPDIELATPNGTDRGHDAVRRLVHLQSYGVAQHVRPRSYIARETTVVVEALIDLRWVDGGELAETMHGVAVFDVRDGHARRFRAEPDLASAFRVAGWAVHPERPADPTARGRGAAASHPAVPAARPRTPHAGATQHR